MSANDTFSTTLLNRRRFLEGSTALGAAAAGFALLAPARGLAQTATPTATDPFAGYPELILTITDNELTVSTDKIAAGYVLLTVVNQTKEPTSAGVIGPRKGQTMADLQAEAATPAANNGFPPFFYTAAILGGPGNVPAGGRSRAVLMMPAGDWAAFPQGNQAPVFFTATEGGGNQTEPASVVQVTEVNYAFGFKREGIVAGTQVWKVTNDGTDPHMLVLGGVPAGTTFEQVVQVAVLPDSATPSPDMLQQSDFRDAGGVILQSAGQTVWTELDLTPGRYAAMCFMSEEDNQQMSHAMEGMIALFDVA